jgi:hypothetical protein
VTVQIASAGLVAVHKSGLGGGDGERDGRAGQLVVPLLFSLGVGSYDKGSVGGYTRVGTSGSEPVRLPTRSGRGFCRGAGTRF